MVHKAGEELALEEKLLQKLKVLNELVWQRKLGNGVVQKWLENFEEEEKLHALYLLSHFLYFGDDEIRQMLRVLFRDLYRQRLTQELYKGTLPDSRCPKQVREHWKKELDATRFVGVGDPSESGTYLLYPFRQENHLGKESFVSSGKILGRDTVTKKEFLKEKDVRHYVFIDDFCGTGAQAVEFSNDIVETLKRLSPNLKTYFLVLVGTALGLERVRDEAKYDFVDAVVELDESYRVFDGDRCFHGAPDFLDKNMAKEIAQEHGLRIYPCHPLGYKDSQLLVGFSHNTPDNTLPIIWCENNWNPAFKRYPK